MRAAVPVALTIAGSDPSGGAGIQADLKTFHQFGVYGQAVITLITVQNTLGVRRIECLPASLVAEQIQAVLEDVEPAAIKTGALGDRAIIEVVAGLKRDLIVDPVMVAKNGTALLSDDACAAMREKLIPHSYLLMPNLREAAVLTGWNVETLEDMRVAARQLADMGARAVLVKGGHLAGDPIDLLYQRGECHEFAAKRVSTVHTHGTGCTYSAAITAGLANGMKLIEAVRTAKAFVQEAITTNPGLGRGAGPLNHHASVGRKRG